MPRRTLDEPCRPDRISPVPENRGAGRLSPPMKPPESQGTVTAVSAKSTRSVEKSNRERIRLLEGLGVEGDVHCGRRARHRSRMAADPEQANLRQVHLIHSELFEELAVGGFEISPGQMGENITTRGIDLLGLPRGTRLFAGKTAVIEVTGLRNPCPQLEEIQEGLISAVLDRGIDGSVIRKSGIMGIVVRGGEIRPGDPIRAELPDGRREPLGPV